MSEKVTTHRPTMENRLKIRELAAIGMPIDMIPYALNPDYPMSMATLTKFYDKDIKAGKAQAFINIGSGLYATAQGGGRDALLAAMFFAKTQMGWQERQSNIKIEPTQEFLTVLEKANGITPLEHAQPVKESTPHTHPKETPGSDKGVPSTEIST